MSIRRVRKGDLEKGLPTSQDLHVNAALTNLAIAWAQESTRFVAGRAFPQVSVEKDADYFHTWDQADFFRDEAEEFDGQDDPPEINLRKSTDLYEIKLYHLAGTVTEREAKNQDAAVNKEETIVRAITNKLLIKREREWVTNFFSASTWTGSTTGADLVGGADFVVWSNLAGSDPVSVIRAEVFQLVKLGIDPMDLKLVLGPEVFQILLDHPKFLERFEQTQVGVLNEALMAQVLGIGEVMVAYGSYNSAVEGATASMAFTHGKHALLLYAPSAPAIDRPSAGYMFAYNGLTGAGADGIRISRWWDPKKRCTYILGETGFVPKKTSAVCGVFFSGAVA